MTERIYTYSEKFDIFYMYVERTDSINRVFYIYENGSLLAEYCCYSDILRWLSYGYEKRISEAEYLKGMTYWS